MLNCRKVTQLISESQDRDLQLRERLALRWHLSMCGACSNFNQQIPFLRELMRDHAKGKEAKPSNDT
jgi:hypothetical protein